MAKIKSPVKGYNGVVVGVSFHEGEAETDNELALNYFARQGYKIEGGAATTAGDSSDGADSGGDLESLSKDALKDRAKALGLHVGGSKPELIERIAEAEAAKAAETETGDDSGNADGENGDAGSGDSENPTPASSGSVREV